MANVTLDPETQVRLKTIEVASNQHLRMNAVAVADLIKYAAALEAYVWNGKSAPKADAEDDDPLG